MKGRTLLGLPVFELSSGTVLGEVRDLLYNPTERKLEGFLITDGGWFWGARILLYEQVKAIGPDAVVIDNAEKIHNTKHHADYKRLYEDRIDIRGLELISNDGELMGVIEDIVLDNHGNIIGYELSSGVVHDLLAGRKIIAAPDNITVSKEMVVFEALMKSED